MDEKRSSGSGEEYTTESLTHEVKKAIGPFGDRAVWARDDGAVCFGDECFTVKPSSTNRGLDIHVNPNKCGPAGEILLEHFIKTAGRGVNFIVDPIVDPDDGG